MFAAWVFTHTHTSHSHWLGAYTVELFAFLSSEELTPIFVFVAFVAATFWVLSLISNRNSQAEERLERIGRG